MNINHNENASLVAGVMLLLAIPSIWPYGYYQLLRWVVSGVAAYNAYGAYYAKKQNWMLVMIGVAILFNPIAPFFLDKETWVVLDIVTAITMFVFSRKMGGGQNELKSSKS